MDIHNRKGQLTRTTERIRNEIPFSDENRKTILDFRSELLKKHRSSISRVLLNLEKSGYIKCINPEDVSFRHYIKK